jgi:hypothetical protein
MSPGLACKGLPPAGAGPIFAAPLEALHRDADTRP